jgi:hypothetical protein
MSQSHPTKQKPSDTAIIIHDQRFAKVHYDPRFQKVPKSKRKLKIDKRFKKMFTDRAFSEPMEHDKYGRRAKRKDPAENMKRFYALQDADEDDENASPVKDEAQHHEQGASETMPCGAATSADTNNTTTLSTKQSERIATKCTSESSVVSNTKSDDSDTTPPCKQSESFNQSSKQTADAESTPTTTTTTTSSSESASSSDEDLLEDNMSEEGHDSLDLLPKEEIPVGSETAQLAVLGCDWDHVKAVDLYMVFQSFLPPRGAIRSVAVYPSDFGLKMMAQERVAGPDVWDTTDDAEVEALSMRKLRAHETARLRYFFALVRCDSPQTALSLYQQLDGYELEHSSNRLDLRFVDDATAQQFTEQRVVSLTLETDLNRLLTQTPRPCVSVCTPETVPANYQPAQWVTRALQMTNVTLTWDQTDPQRTRILQRNLSAPNAQEPLRESDYQAYLASSHSSDTLSSDSASGASHSDSDSEVPSPEAILERIRRKREKRKAKRAEIRARYAALLGGFQQTEAESGLPPETEGEMEVTFTSGLSQRAEQLIEAKMKERQKVSRKKFDIPVKH